MLVLPSFGGDVPPSHSGQEDLNDVINRYVAAQRIQAEAMKGAQVDEVIGANVPKLKKGGTWRVLKVIPRVGEITFRPIGQYFGDNTIKKEVIERFLTLEQKQRDMTALAITPDKYTFKVKQILTDKSET